MSTSNTPSYKLSIDLTACEATKEATKLEISVGKLLIALSTLRVYSGGIPQACETHEVQRSWIRPFDHPDVINRL